MKPFGQGQCIKGVQVFHHGQQFFNAMPPRLLIQGWQGYTLPRIFLHSGRLNDLDGYDFRGIIVPLGELGFAKGDFPDFLLIRLVFGKELDRGALGLFDSDTARFITPPNEKDLPRKVRVNDRSISLAYPSCRGGQRIIR
jgi:hypothetical protein